MKAVPKLLAYPSLSSAYEDRCSRVMLLMVRMMAK